MKAFGYIRPIFKERGKINAEVTGRLTETLNGVRVIKGFNAEEQENKSFEKLILEKKASGLVWAALKVVLSRAWQRLKVGENRS